MRYTRTADAQIRAELLALEREMAPQLETSEPEELSGVGAWVAAFDELYRDHDTLTVECRGLQKEVMRWRAFYYGALFTAAVLLVAVLGLMHSIEAR